MKKIFHSNKIKKTLERFLLYVINGMCLVFVTWQTIKFLTNYIDEPKGTTVSMKKTAQMAFPAITVCGSSTFSKTSTEEEYFEEEYFPFNHTYLNETCGIR